MNKISLERFITKYYLNGITESVILHTENGTLNTKFCTDDKKIIGIIKTSEISWEDGIYGIYDTSQLKRLLSALNEEINISVITSNNRAISLSFTDSRNVKVNFVLASTENISSGPKLSNLPHFEIEYDINKSFIDLFVKSKSALPEIETVAVLFGNKVNMILGHSRINTNKITIPLENVSTTEHDPVHFHAAYFASVLTANKDAESGKLSISSEGLIKIEFLHPSFQAIYYLTAVDVQE